MKGVLPLRIDLASDTVTKPTPAMREAMAGPKRMAKLSASSQSLRAVTRLDVTMDECREVAELLPQIFTRGLPN